MTKQISVIKRDGTKEPLSYEKINKILLWATDGIKDVSASDVAMNAQLQIYDKITTEEIHNVLIQSAVNMISVESPNYQFVASKLANYLLRKKVFNTYKIFPKLKDFVKQNVDKGIYDPIFLEKYDDNDFSKIEYFIKHERDEELAYAGIQQLMDKYLIKDRSTGEIYETPQFAYILISMFVFANETDKKKRLKNIKECYDLISTLVISLPTPIIAGVRTPNRQFSSCTLIDVDDSLDSIIASDAAVMKYISKRAGIGLNMRIRGAGSKIRHGEVVHTGIVPFIKKFESTVKSCSQGGIRNGSSTVHYPIWHSEIEDILVLKNNRGNDMNRARRLDHSIQLSKLFYRRFVKNEDISLFSPSDVPGLYEAFGYNDKFDPLYEKYEKDKSIPRKTVKMRDIMSLLVKERLETGRIYVQNLDNVNDQNKFKDKIYMSNLCLSGDTNVKVRCFDMQEPEIVKYGLIEENDYHFAVLTLEELNNLFNDIYIESYRIDDVVATRSRGHIKVESKDLNTGEVEYCSVIKSAQTGTNREVMKITDTETGKSIVCTPEHGIYTKNRGYVMAKTLTENDILDISNTETSCLSIDTHENLDVFDITVEKNHNFFANDILVHNCQEIVLPTEPIKDMEDYLTGEEGEIALCTLAALNVGNVKNYSVLQKACKHVIYILDMIVELQDYPVSAAKKMIKRRSLGVGITNYAYYLAKNNVKYGSPEALELTDELFEHIQYYLMQSSNELAKERGACEWFDKTLYNEGKLPIDMYNKNVDSLVNRPYSLDWEKLREDIKTYGLVNSVFTAQMPCESCVSSETNIITEDGVKSIKTILEEQNIDYKKLEEEGVQKWIEFEKPFNVETMLGLDITERIFYNGEKEVLSITFEDGKTYHMTNNHKLLVDRDGEFVWTRADELEEGLFIVNNNDVKTMIDSISKTKTVHTYDIEVKNQHHYILDNGCVSHNSSVVSSSTNGIEPPRALITQKKSKSGSPLPVVIQDISKIKNKIELAFEIDNDKINKTVAVMQKWIDQGISVNHYYDKSKYEDGNISMKDVVNDLLQFYKLGGKQLYYANSKDGMSDKLEDMIGKEDENRDVYIDEDDGGGCVDGACQI